MRAIPERCVLYLHGRGSQPLSSPGDLIAQQPWGLDVYAPCLTEEWLAQPFPELVREVDGWLDRSALALGHSFGAWLLLCTALERVTRGDVVSDLCLFASLLGKGFSQETGVGFFCPRSRTVRAALGLEEDRRDPMPLRDRIRLVHADRDEQTAMADVERLIALGYSVQIVPGGHRLEHPAARAAFASLLSELTKKV